MSQTWITRVAICVKVLKRGAGIRRVREWRMSRRERVWIQRVRGERVWKMVGEEEEEEEVDRMVEERVERKIQVQREAKVRL